MRGNMRDVSCIPFVLRSRRASLDSVRLAPYIALAIEFLCSPAARPRYGNGLMKDLVFLALLTAGTPAFATVDAKVRMCYRDDVSFQTFCAMLVEETTSTMEVLVLEEYMRLADDESEGEMSS
ncbi:hypothetical protein SPRG_11983 [Saprolegnia parasitica CBS 223.65]|uniref:Uncharacterized protein n=1 Tax=Saprolegnia parasitica (strain CBS 223.65) TaxID=695850 RepID=A0A067C8I2_SAPPC|nr:hypothetical protein SPRG_11983 [Saprolegnia parasitica CBS 223.65]KDO22846.1 hypothetical protein SPRG_11983 [Saprolegnia parasitica CBS 223.65]|eukprot:XP_012206403.1 hypothetical protein SPRG_11983 [Saprolegnia parasitica CBS 223.65]